MNETMVKTQADGTFTITVRHRPMQMPRLEVRKKGFAMREKAEFPGFAAPDEIVEVELIPTVSY